MSVHPCDFVGGGGEKGLGVSRDPFGPRGLLIPLPLRKNRFDLCSKVERRSGYLHFLSLFPCSPQPAIFRVRTEYNVPVSCKNCFLSVERDEGRKENFQSVMSEKRKICFFCKKMNEAYFGTSLLGKDKKGSASEAANCRGGIPGTGSGVWGRMHWVEKGGGEEEQKE